MKNLNNFVNNLYRTDNYIKKNPSLHEEDSLWKVSKIMPLVDKFISCINKDEINLLDVGGGAGIILKEVSIYINKKYGIKVNKYILDLSPGMLKIQKKRNPDMKKMLNEDICKTTFENKEIDLTLMIDVLEHISNPQKALNELRRISNFVIFKVPLENCLFSELWNFVNKGKTRQYIIESIGHINIYNTQKLKQQIEKNLGKILDYYFTNVFAYYLNSNYYKKNMKLVIKIKNFIASFVFKLSPKLCSFILNDYVMILVKCY